MSEYDAEVSNWWKTSIIDMAPGKIEFRGTPIQNLMGEKSFSQMIWYMVIGGELSKEQAELFDLAMLMGVDHSPQAPSIAISRMGITCGIGINNAMASAINVLGDNHGGAGEQCAELFYDIQSRIKSGKDLKTAVADGVADYQEKNGKVIPGYGHRFHKDSDPRAIRTFEVLPDYVSRGVISGEFIEIAKEVENYIADKKGRVIPLNVDGATSIIFCELGVPAPLSRGFFCLSRSVGILSHAWEQMGQNEKNKGPMPKKYLPEYEPAE
ncbi:MAG: citryl-CoA lyase [Alphaproteobacteria bacterium]